MMLSPNAYCEEGAPKKELSFQELEIIVGHLEIGTVVTKFFKNKQPDKRNLLFKRESRQIVWYKEMSKRNVYEGISKRIYLLRGNVVSLPPNLKFSPFDS